VDTWTDCLCIWLLQGKHTFARKFQHDVTYYSAHKQCIHQVEPAKVVDKAIKIFLDVVTPGRGAGESNWLIKGWRTMEQSADRTSREMDIRSDLRNWDKEYPMIHHELLVRYICGALASGLVMGIYDGFRRDRLDSRRRYY